MLTGKNEIIIETAPETDETDIFIDDEDIINTVSELDKNIISSSE